MRVRSTNSRDSRLAWRRAVRSATRPAARLCAPARNAASSSVSSIVRRCSPRPKAWTARGRIGSPTLLARLAEMLFAEAVHGYIATLAETRTSWLAGRRDANVGFAPGDGSEAAFSRAFERHHGLPPAV